MELRNLRLITATDKKRNTKGVRDGKRRNALRSELRRKTLRTDGPLIILCPPYLTTFAGNTRASTPSIRINIVHNYCTSIRSHKSKLSTRDHISEKNNAADMCLSLAIIHILLLRKRKSYLFSFCLLIRCVEHISVCYVQFSVINNLCV